MCSGSSLDRCTWVCFRTNTRPSSSLSLGQSRPTGGKAWQAGSWGQNTVRHGTFWGVCSILLRASGAQLLLDIPTPPTDPLGEVMIFGVSWGATTDLLGRGGLSGQVKEMIIFRDKQTIHHDIFIILFGRYHLYFQV